VRTVAVWNLTDQTLLAHVAKTDSDPAVRRAAVGRLTDQAVLAAIATSAGHSDVRQGAVEKLTDQAQLAEIAKTDGDCAVRTVAVWELTDQALLSQIAKTDGDPGVRRAAGDRLEELARDKDRNGNLGEVRCVVPSPAVPFPRAAGMKTGWHFTRLDGRLSYDDRRRVRLGETLTVEGELEVGARGLHFSERVVEALRYAPGSRLWCVEGSAELLGNGICCGCRRTALVDYGDVLSLITAFADHCCRQAWSYHNDCSAAGVTAEAVSAAEAVAKEAVEASAAADHAASVAACGTAEDARAVAASHAVRAASHAVRAAAHFARAVAFAATGGDDIEAEDAAAEAVATERELQENWWQEKLKTIPGRQ
jgi:hypothetical protein